MISKETIGGTPLIKLIEITEDNWLEAARLSVAEEQKGYVASAVGIIARGYVYRDCQARVWGIAAGEQLVGLALVRIFDEEPVCYDLQQLMIDARFQNRGYGTAALGLIIEKLKAEGAYPCVEVCVKREDAQALHVYEKAGFVDTGYVDENVPDCVNWVLRF